MRSAKSSPRMPSHRSVGTEAGAGEVIDGEVAQEERRNQSPDAHDRRRPVEVVTRALLINSVSLSPSWGDLNCRFAAGILLASCRTGTEGAHQVGPERRAAGAQNPLVRLEASTAAAAAIASSAAWRSRAPQRAGISLEEALT